MYHRQAASEGVAGYSQEDRVLFRAFFDSEHRTRDHLEPNLIAGTFVNQEGLRGRFVIAKIERNVEDQDGVESLVETLVPYSKQELVDLCVWRRFCGSNLAGTVSTRVFRENMRRKELEGYVAQNKTNQTLVDI